MSKCHKHLEKGIKKNKNRSAKKIRFFDIWMKIFDVSDK